MAELEFTDRYQALGIPYPDPETMCKGQCDGVGLYPLSLNIELEGAVITDEERRRWQALHDAPDAHVDGPCDGWHFIRCPKCNGTGKESP